MKPTTVNVKRRRCIAFAENAYSTASLMNLMLFLRKGRYRSLLERLLGARLVYKEPNMSRVISFEYLNRQLVWQELSVRFVMNSFLFSSFFYHDKKISKENIKKKLGGTWDGATTTVFFAFGASPRTRFFSALD